MWPRHTSRGGGAPSSPLRAGARSIAGRLRASGEGTHSGAMPEVVHEVVEHSDYESGVEAVEEIEEVQEVEVTDSEAEGAAQAPKRKKGLLVTIANFADKHFDNYRGMSASQRFAVDFPSIITYLIALFCLVSTVECLLRVPYLVATTFVGELRRLPTPLLKKRYATLSTYANLLPRVAISIVPFVGPYALEVEDYEALATFVAVLEVMRFFCKGRDAKDANTMPEEEGARRLDDAAFREKRKAERAERRLRKELRATKRASVQLRKNLIDNGLLRRSRTARHSLVLWLPPR